MQMAVPDMEEKVFFFLNSDGARADNKQYQVIWFMVVGILRARDSILDPFSFQSSVVLLGRLNSL